MSTTEHRPAPSATPGPVPAETPFTDEPTDRLPIVLPRNRRAGRHRAQAGEVAALAFTAVPVAIPVQRTPAPIEYRSAS